MFLSFSMSLVSLLAQASCEKLLILLSANFFHPMSSARIFSREVMGLFSSSEYASDMRSLSHHFLGQMTGVPYSSASSAVSPNISRNRDGMKRMSDFS